MIYYDNKHNEFYFPFNRNGSTLIFDISNTVNYLKEKELPEALALIERDKNIPIYVPFRDPIVRFKSGLSVNFLRECEEESGNKNITSVPPKDKYKIVLNTLKNLYLNHISHHLLSKFIMPFHLNDVHLDHCLWRPLILLANGYNVKLIPMNKLSDHLHSRFPTTLNLIKERERKNSFNVVRRDTEGLWDIYKEIFIDIPMYKDKFNMQNINWYLWMRDEQTIFDQFCLYQDSPNLNFVSGKMILTLLQGKAYFSDTNSVMLPSLMFMLEEIKKHRELCPEIQSFHATYAEYIRSGTLIQRGDFLEKRRKRKLPTSKRAYKIDII